MGRDARQDEGEVALDCRADEDRGEAVAQDEMLEVHAGLPGRARLPAPVFARHGGDRKGGARHVCQAQVGQCGVEGVVDVADQVVFRKSMAGTFRIRITHTLGARRSSMIVSLNFSAAAKKNGPLIS